MTLPDPATPSGRQLRARLEGLDVDTRQHIAHQVRHGRVLREREWAFLAIGVARIRRREVLLLCLLAPGMVLLAALLGSVGAHWSLGADPAAAAWLVLSWNDGLPWLALWAGLTTALLVATRSYRSRLRRAEERNLERIRR